MTSSGYTCKKNNINIVLASGETYLAIAYFDPTNLSTSCNASNSVSTTGTKEGCMKWYVYKEDSNYYYAILDHNTTAKVPTFGTALTHLPTDTSSWVNSLNPRFITADEIAEITGNTSWSQSTATSDWFYFDSNSQTQTATSRGASKYAWLYDYTYNCISNGCNTQDSSVNGYWTSNYKTGDTSLAWRVYNVGGLRTASINYDGYGERPVVTISKS